MAYDVKFLKGTSTSYQSLVDAGKIDKNTFYYTDESDLYLGLEKLTSEPEVQNALTRIEANEKSIQDIFAELESLQGGGSGDGSLSQQISNLRAELEGKINENKTAIENEEQRATQAEGQIATDLSELEALVNENETDIEQKVSDLTGRVSDNEAGLESQASVLASAMAKLNILIGEDVDKSARQIANEELAKQLIPENASEAMNTLEELAAWLQQHPEDAAAMNLAITQNSEAIAELKPTVQDNKDRLDSLQTAIAGLSQTVAGHTTSIESHETSIQEMLDEATGILAQSKDYTDGVISSLELGTASKKNVEDFDAAGSAAAALADAMAYTDSALTWGSIVTE